MPSADDLRGSATHVFVDPATLDADGDMLVDADVHHHLSRVLRLGEGETVSLSDGRGRWRLSRVHGRADSLRLEPSGPVEIAAEPASTLTIATAIPKGDRLDWMVQKLTELGVGRIQLLHSDHSVVRWKAERATKQLARLARISLEAARQSRRVRLVEIIAPVDAAQVLSDAVIAEPGGRTVRSGDDTIAIGPEGGWSSAEQKMARDQVSLGPNILRTETAALAATTLWVVAGH